ncbi:MAG: hypothetical protein KAJ55_03760 [Anaerolineales bacterium]|nr:hypothetical protein [Anaerolineales bacterium]
MTLEATIQDKAKIPEALVAHYVETDGVFHLDVNGMKTQKDFDDYAEALKKRLTDAGADFARKQGAGLSRDDVLEVVEGALKKFAAPGAKPGKGNGADGGDGEPGDVSARLHDVERNLASVTKELETAKKERDDALGKSKDTTIRNSLTQAANAAGATPEGVTNLVSLIETNFEVAQDGSVVTKLEAAAGVSPNQKPEDFLAAVARDKAFRMFWPKSVGAGADGEGAGGPGAGGDLGKGNPFSKAGWNMTAQSKLFASNKPEAERLMKSAGVELGAVAPVR